jgi:putative peptidoglycan lipid II flippase
LPPAPRDAAKLQKATGGVTRTEDWSTRRVLTGTAVLAGTNLAGKLITMFKEGSVASQFGATRLSDQLALAQLYPGILCGVAASTVAIALPPAVEMLRKRTGSEPSFAQVAWTVGICLGALFVIGVSALFWAKPLLAATAPSWSDGDINETAQYLGGFYAASWLLAASSLIAAFLVIMKVFFAGGLATALDGLFAGVFVLGLTRYLGGASLVIGSIADGFCGLVIVGAVLVLVSRRSGKGRLEPIQWAALRTVTLPAIAVYALANIPVLAERSAAASLAVGDLALLRWAQRLSSLPLAIAILPLAQAVYPSLARRSEQDDESPDLKLESVAGYYLLAGLSTVAAAIAVGVSAPLVGVVLQHGRFDAAAAARATDAVRILLAGVPGAAVLTLAQRVLYARRKGTRVLIGFAIGVGAELAILYPALHRFGLNGVCLAISVGLTVTGIVLLVLVNPSRSPDVRGTEMLKGGLMMCSGFTASFLSSWILRGWPVVALLVGLLIGSALTVLVGVVFHSMLTEALGSLRAHLPFGTRARRARDS